jgi:hypothetical protein
MTVEHEPSGASIFHPITIPTGKRRPNEYPDPLKMVISVGQAHDVTKYRARSRAKDYVFYERGQRIPQAFPFGLDKRR